jgi:hypothetical protein
MMATRTPAAPKLPKTLAQCADRLYEVRELRLQNDRSSKIYKEEESLLKTRLINELPKSDASGIAGKTARATVVTKDLQTVEDWAKVYDWVIDEAIKHRRKKTGLEHSVFDIFQRSVVQSALDERLDRGEKVPGLKKFKVVTVSLSKV